MNRHQRWKLKRQLHRDYDEWMRTGARPILLPPTMSVTPEQAAVLAELIHYTEQSFDDYNQNWACSAAESEANDAERAALRERVDAAFGAGTWDAAPPLGTVDAGDA